MAEVLVEYPDIILGEDGTQYRARACATRVSENTWHGWIEFESLDGQAVTRSPRETTQPNRTDAMYWATGITPVYLEGALRRALHPQLPRPAARMREPEFDAPAPDATTAAPAADAILDPFALFAKSEQHLRRQLAALSSWHLVNIVKAYSVVTPTDPNRMTSPALIEAIVGAVRERTGATLTD